MNNDSFYKDLTPLPSFEFVGDPTLYQEAPHDWHIVITDVQGSTKAIEAGKYKEVNIAGAASVAALLHSAPHIDIPFVFGGDGASFLIPNSMLPGAKKALLGAKELSRDALGLDLRLGIVPVAEVAKRGARVLVGKFPISKKYIQGVFSGGGFGEAEKLIKAEGSPYLINNEPLKPEASFAGLSCRWEDVASIHGETVSLLVKATAASELENNEIYRSIIQKIIEIYGDDAMHHPVPLEKLQISLSNAIAMSNARIRTGSANPFLLAWNFLEAKAGGIILKLMTQFNLGSEDPGLKNYQKFLVDAVDYRKFDDALRTIISGTTESREKLTTFLELERGAGRIAYGIHVSDRAILTCLVMKKMERQVHFIDGADGGYTLAARQLKEQLNNKKATH